MDDIPIIFLTLSISLGYLISISFFKLSQISKKLSNIFTKKILKWPCAVQIHVVQEPTINRYRKKNLNILPRIWVTWCLLA